MGSINPPSSSNQVNSKTIATVRELYKGKVRALPHDITLLQDEVDYDTLVKPSDKILLSISNMVGGPENVPEEKPKRHDSWLQRNKQQQDHRDQSRFSQLQYAQLPPNTQSNGHLMFPQQSMYEQFNTQQYTQQQMNTQHTTQQPGQDQMNSQQQGQLQTITHQQQYSAHQNGQQAQQQYYNSQQLGQYHAPMNAWTPNQIDHDARGRSRSATSWAPVWDFAAGKSFNSITRAEVKRQCSLSPQRNEGPSVLKKQIIRNYGGTINQEGIFVSKIGGKQECRPDVGCGKQAPICGPSTCPHLPQVNPQCKWSYRCSILDRVVSDKPCQGKPACKCFENVTQLASEDKQASLNYVEESKLGADGLINNSLSNPSPKVPKGEQTAEIVSSPKEAPQKTPSSVVSPETGLPEATPEKLLPPTDRLEIKKRQPPPEKELHKDESMWDAAKNMFNKGISNFQEFFHIETEESIKVTGGKKEEETSLGKGLGVALEKPTDIKELLASPKQDKTEINTSPPKLSPLTETITSPAKISPVKESNTLETQNKVVGEINDTDITVSGAVMASPKAPKDQENDKTNVKKKGTKDENGNNLMKAIIGAMSQGNNQEGPSEKVDVMLKQEQPNAKNKSPSDKESRTPDEVSVNKEDPIKQQSHVQHNKDQRLNSADKTQNKPLCDEKHRTPGVAKRVNKLEQNKQQESPKLSSVKKDEDEKAISPLKAILNILSSTAKQEEPCEKSDDFLEKETLERVLIQTRCKGDQKPKPGILRSVKIQQPNEKKSYTSEIKQKAASILKFGRKEQPDTEETFNGAEQEIKHNKSSSELKQKKADMLKFGQKREPNSAEKVKIVKKDHPNSLEPSMEFTARPKKQFYPKKSQSVGQPKPVEEKDLVDILGSTATYSLVSETEESLESSVDVKPKRSVSVPATKGKPSLMPKEVFQSQFKREFISDFVEPVVKGTRPNSPPRSAVDKKKKTTSFRVFSGDSPPTPRIRQRKSKSVDKRFTHLAQAAKVIPRPVRQRPQSSADVRIEHSNETNRSKAEISLKEQYLTILKPSMPYTPIIFSVKSEASANSSEDNNEQNQYEKDERYRYSKRLVNIKK